MKIKEISHFEKSNFELSAEWTRRIAIATLVIGSLGWISSISTFAADQDFNSGKRNFSNPYADAPDDTDAFLEDDFKLPGSPSPAPSRRSRKPNKEIQIGGKKDPKDVPNPNFTPNGIQVGGETPGGVISNNRIDPILLETDTGRGSNEVITDFNFPEADIMDIAKTLGKLTGKNFITDKDVKGRISIISNSPITVGDAWRAFLTALDMNDYTLIPSGKYIRISRIRDARDKQINTYIGEYSPNSDALITRVFPLKHISADEVARTFRSFMPASSRIIPYPQTNTVIVTDTGSNIQKLSKMLEFLDIEGFDAGIEVIQVKYASAENISKLIDTLLPGSQNTPKTRRRSRTSSFNDFSARRTKEGGVINAIIADSRTNSLIVHANGKGVEQVKKLVNRLDSKIPNNIGGGKIHVIYLQFAAAEELAKTMNDLTNTPTSSRRTSSRTRTSGIGVNPKVTELFEGSIRVSADKSTNSLVVTASPSDFETLKRVVAQLDIPRDEVYAEIVIMELNMSKEFDFSANVISPASGLGLVTKPSDILSSVTAPFSQAGAVLGFAEGKSVNLRVGNQDFQVKSIQGLIKAIQTNSLGTVLATPQILTLDNVEAKFESNEKIPVPSTTTTGNTGVVNASVSKEPIGISISIKPQINKLSSFVKLEIKAKLEAISARKPPAAVADQAFATLERTAETEVVVADHDTVVLGGLIRDRQDEIEAKVPLLGDIPVLGWLFRSTTRTSQKTNLLLFITPHIIRQYEKIRAILDKKLKERDDFIQKNVGGEDRLRDYRDNMIRNLPAISDIVNQHIDNARTIDTSQSKAKRVKKKKIVKPAKKKKGKK
ncbi:MAG: type II secretion system protein GspD [Bdellovibrionaceae bacterium]|nr:type II secretion system protein GspD [Pseudobdellovibrionaceae bacterium]